MSRNEQKVRECSGPRPLSFRPKVDNLGYSCQKRELSSEEQELHFFGRMGRDKARRRPPFVINS